MKKKLALLLVGILCVCCCACGSKGKNGKDYGKDEKTEKTSLFLSITNAKEDVELTVVKDADLKDVKDSVKKDKVSNKGKTKLIEENIAGVDVQDRWTGTYNCADIEKDAIIIVTPKSKDNNLMAVNMSFDREKVSVSGDAYEDAEFTSDGTVTINKAKEKFEVSYSNHENMKMNDLRLDGTCEDKANITVIANEDGTYTVKANKEIKTLSAMYMTNDMKTEEYLNSDAMSEESGTEFKIEFKDNKVSVTKIK